MNSDVMECSACGYRIADSDRFCLRCGEDVFKTRSTANSSQPESTLREDIWEVIRAPDYSKTASTSKSRIRKIALVIILMALLGAGGALGYFFWETIVEFLPFFG